MGSDNRLIGEEDVVYLSGPMSNMPKCNRNAFFQAAAEIRRIYGCEVLNPAALPQEKNYPWYIRKAMKQIRKATVVVTLPGAALSDGARVEIRAAGDLDIPVIPIEEIVPCRRDG